VAPKGNDAQTIMLFQSDGKTRQAVGTQTSTSTVWQIMRDNGTTVAAELNYENGTRTSIKLFDEDGKVLYQDSRAPGTQSWLQTYVGTVFDKQGKPTFRVTIDENTWNGGTVKKIEEFDTDGVTVKKSTDLPYWNPQQIPLGVYANQQELVSTKVHQTQAVTSASTDLNTMWKALTTLLKQ
jgi:hypothetical protein